MIDVDSQMNQSQHKTKHAASAHVGKRLQASDWLTEIVAQELFFLSPETFAPNWSDDKSFATIQLQTAKKNQIYKSSL